MYAGMHFDTPTLDLLLQQLINQQGHTLLLNGVMRLLSSKTALFVLLLPAALLAARRLGKRQFVLFAVLLIGMGISDFGTSLVKDQIGRVRPLNSQPGTWFVEDGAWRRRPADFVQTKESGSSYPSAHASNTACLVLLAFRLWPGMRRRQRLALAALPLLVGYSRVYLGKHYPTDVLAGWLFGAVVAVLVGLAWQEWGQGRLDATRQE